MIIRACVSPDSLAAGQPCRLEVRLACDRDLAPGDTIEFQFPNSWSLLTGPSYTRPIQAADPAAPHHVSVSAPGAGFRIAIRPRHLNFPECEARHGRLITATLDSGSVPAGRDVLIAYSNTVAPYVAETESLWLRVCGEPPAQPPPLVTPPGPAQSIRLIAPSAAEPGRPFEVLIVSLDRFDNCSNSAFRDLRLLHADGSPAAAGLSFTGSVRVPLSIGEPGVHRFRLVDPASGADVWSNAVRVAHGARGPFWGDVHIHTKLSSDAQGVNPYPYARDVSGLDFAAAADHSESLGPEGCRILEEWAEAANQPGRFVTIPADERNPELLSGHHNIYFRDLDSFRRHAPIPGSAFGLQPAAQAEWLRSLDPARALLIPHHTGIAWGDLPADGIGSAVRWDAFPDPPPRPVIEIYSHHGQSERFDPQHVLAYEFNRMRNPERRANTSVPGPYYAQDHWLAGRRLGVIGSSDEHSGQGGRRHGGLAAVFADSLTREAVFDALRARRCYATTGERILLDFSVDGVPMGGEAARAKGSRIPIALDVWATNLLLRVEILRCRIGLDRAFLPIFSNSARPSRASHLGPGPKPETMDCSCRIEDEVAGPTIYYARVTQQPLDWPGMAWSSPVWLDTVR